MPTISFSLKDLEKLLGKKLEVSQVEELIEYGKGDFEGYDKEEDDFKVEFGDTNLPYLWSVEGFARLVRGILGKQKGIPPIKINKGEYKLIVDKSVSKVRPYIAAFVAKGCKIDEDLLKQVIQLQEKLCDNFGRRREKVAIGVYSHKKIRFPVRYKATDPESVKFIPLEFRKEMTQQEILEEHPTGQKYSWILEGMKKYPILIDSKDDVLSFPPIINSMVTGKVEPGESDIFFEATGNDLTSLLLATNIFAYALSDRGFRIYSVDVKYPDGKTINTPSLFKDTIKLDKKDIKKLLGLELKESEVKALLEKMGYGYQNGLVKIAPYRKDILHAHDVIEDIGIGYGYDKIPEVALESYTIGETSHLVEFCDKVRELLVGLGYQEVMSPIMSNKEFLTKKMNCDVEVVEIDNFISETYSAVRSWLLPVLLEVLSKNKHVEYPQRIFEQGSVSVRKSEAVDHERVALVSAHEKADYTEAKQALDFLLRMLGIKYEIFEASHDSFIAGRVGRVVVNGKKVAYIGEFNPEVLSNWDIDVPVVGFELNLTELFEATS